jgi:hypothetical protein
LVKAHHYYSGVTIEKVGGIPPALCRKVPY